MSFFDFTHPVANILHINDNLLYCLYGGVVCELVFAAEGAYTKTQKKMLYCIIPLSQLPELKSIVKTLYNRVFLTIADASEVEGKGYRHLI